MIASTSWIDGCSTSSPDGPMEISPASLLGLASFSDGQVHHHRSM